MYISFVLFIKRYFCYRDCVLDDRLGERLLAEDTKSLTIELAIAKAEAYERAKTESICLPVTHDSTLLEN